MILGQNFPRNPMVNFVWAFEQVCKMSFLSQHAILSFSYELTYATYVKLVNMNMLVFCGYQALVFLFGMISLWISGFLAVNMLSNNTGCVVVLSWQMSEDLGSRPSLRRWTQRGWSRRGTRVYPGSAPQEEVKAYVLLYCIDWCIDYKGADSLDLVLN